MTVLYMRMKKLYDRIQKLEEEKDDLIRYNKRLEHKLKSIEEYMSQYEEKGHRI